MKRILSIALACVILFTSLSFAKESEEKPITSSKKAKKSSTFIGPTRQ